MKLNHVIQRDCFLNRNKGKLVILSLCGVFLLTLWNFIANRSEAQTRELWIVNSPVISAPFSVGPRHRHDRAQEIEDIVKDLIKTKTVGNVKMNVDRGFNSSILYLSISENQQKSKIVFDKIYQETKLKTKEPIKRVSLPIKTNHILKNRLSITLLYLSLITIIGLTLVILWIQDMKPKPIILIYIYATSLCLALYWYNTATIGKVTEVETKVLNNLTPHSKNYMHLYASSALKSMVGEVTLSLLEGEGYPGGIRILNEDHIFTLQTKKTKADTLWISSTASGKIIAKAKVDAEKLVKDLLFEAKAKTSLEEHPINEK